MAIYKITEEQSDRYHAKKQVDKFLDGNKMYSDMQLDIFKVPEFLNYGFFTKQLPADILATVQKENNKLSIYIQEGAITREKALAVCYILGYEFYKDEEIKNALLNYEEAFENMFYDKASTRGIKKWYDTLPPEEKKAMVEWELKTNSDYVIGVGEAELAEANKFTYFAEDLLSRDYLPRFKVQKTTEPEMGL